VQVWEYTGAANSALSPGVTVEIDFSDICAHIKDADIKFTEDDDDDELVILSKSVWADMLRSGSDGGPKRDEFDPIEADEEEMGDDDAIDQANIIAGARGEGREGRGNNSRYADEEDGVDAPRRPAPSRMHGQIICNDMGCGKWRSVTETLFDKFADPYSNFTCKEVATIKNAGCLSKCDACKKGKGVMGCVC
jgi:hypothetical protein